MAGRSIEEDDSDGRLSVGCTAGRNRITARAIPCECARPLRRWLCLFEQPRHGAAHCRRCACNGCRAWRARRGRACRCASRRDACRHSVRSLLVRVRDVARSPGHLARVTVRPVRGARCNLHEDGGRKLGLLASELGVDALRDHMRAGRKRQDFSARTRGGRLRRSKRSVTHDVMSSPTGWAQSAPRRVPAPPYPPALRPA